MIEIQNNFLDKETHQRLLSIVKHRNFNWQLLPVVDENSTEYQFCHPLYGQNYSEDTGLPILGGNIVSNFYYNFMPLFEKIGIKLMHRVKVNCTCKDSIQREFGGWHYDYYWENKPMEELKIAIYYLDTTNGQTLIKENSKIVPINCEANTLVTFPNTLEHTGTTHTDLPFRYVVNMNYI